MSGKVRVAATANARAPLQSFFVTGDLCGRRHRFDFEDRSVEITIPQIEFGEDARPLPRYQDIARYRQGWVNDRRPEVTTYEIDRVDVSISVPEEIFVPKEMLELPPNQYELAGPELVKFLDEISQSYKGILARAMKHWCEVFRWVLGSSDLGASHSGMGREPEADLDLVALERADDRHRFWLPSSNITVPRLQGVNASIWDAIGKALSGGHVAPIWSRYLDEAHHRYIEHDVTGAIISSAIACETIARECFWLSSGATKRASARNLLDKISIGGVFEKWHDLTGLSKSEVPISDVKKLFTRRNRLMHSGVKGAPSDGEKDELLLKSARLFVFVADKWYFENLGQDNPRIFEASN